jgi:Holliday junction resolvasome RuvABC ATP-dependent DNA helicase subunit
MIQDAGYYYEGFNIQEGAKLLKEVIETHDENHEVYVERCEEVLTRYTVYNEGLIETYNKLLDNLVDGKNTHGLSYEYDWKTNLYK